MTSPEPLVQAITNHVVRAAPGRVAGAAARGTQQAGRAALARVMLWLGIAATVGANIAYGVGFGLLGAVISAWPTVAFIGSVELVMQLVRRDVPPLSVAPGDVEQA
jgi:hypothetical protein